MHTTQGSFEEDNKLNKDLVYCLHLPIYTLQ